MTVSFILLYCHFIQALELDVAGKKEEAERAANMARKFNIMGLITASISTLISMIFIFALIIALART